MAQAVLRVLCERMVRELPKRELDLEEPANEALYVVEEMRELLEGVSELSDSFEVREEIGDVHRALEASADHNRSINTPQHTPNPRRAARERLRVGSGVG